MTAKKRTYKELLDEIRELREQLAEKNELLNAIQNGEILRQITDNAEEVFWLLNADLSKVIYVSPAYEKIWQRTVQSVLDRPLSWMESVHPDDIGQLKQVMEKSFKTGLDEEFRLLRKDQDVRWIWARTFPIKDASGSLYRVLGVARDITERKRLDEELINIQKLESVGILAGGIAHDFNNLLTAIIGNITLAKVRVNEKENLTLLLDKAESATMRAAELTKRLITFAKGGMPVTGTLYLNEIINDAALFAISGSNVTCRFQVPYELWPVKADEGQIRQVVQNIVFNAKEAMPNGGQVRIYAENLEITGNEGLPLRAGRYIKVSIIDSGTGIHKKDISHIFDPYFSTKERGAQKGMGLGLAVCHSIIAKHKGHIMADSKAGSGTAIHFYLPASEEKPEGRRIPKILIMDDELIVLEVATSILTESGFEVEKAYTGEDAIRLYIEAMDSGRPFDAVILDLTVPGAMGGLQALRRLISIDPRVKAIVSSGYLNDVVLTKFQEYGFLAAVPKPYRPEDLVNTVARITGRGPVFH